MNAYYMSCFYAQLFYKAQKAFSIRKTKKFNSYLCCFFLIDDRSYHHIQRTQIIFRWILINCWTKSVQSSDPKVQIEHDSWICLLILHHAFVGLR